MNRIIAQAGGLCAIALVGVSLAYVFRLVDLRQLDDGQNELHTLAYVDVVRISPAEREIAGVTELVHDKVSAGVNVYTPFMGNSAQLLDMQGNTLHVLTDRRQQSQGSWEFVKPYVNGRFLVLAELSSSPLFIIDWESNVIWESHMRFHHDASFDAEGRIYAFCRELLDAPAISKQDPILNDRLVTLSKEGRIENELSLAAMFVEDPVLLEIIRGEDYKEHQAAPGEHGPPLWDVFHTNTVEVLSTSADLIAVPAFRSGNVLFCSRHLDLIGVIDVEAERVVWHWGPGELDNPHGATLLDNGHILVVDNGTRRGRSRIVEMDPKTGKVVDTLGDAKKTEFFTAFNGGVQRMPNGNTLIVESQRGRVFEVAPDGTLVWEFYSFPMTDKNLRPSLYRMPRIVDQIGFPELQTMLYKTNLPIQSKF